MIEIWTTEQEAAKLRERFAAVPNKAAFARTHGVPGGASMQSQHLSGHRPMSLAAATAYATGFGVTLAEISPRMAKEVAAASSPAPHPSYLPDFESLRIPPLANSGSMGPGSDPLHDEVVIGRLTVSPDWAFLRPPDWREGSTALSFSFAIDISI